MDGLHEGVEVDTGLAGDVWGEGVVEEVHHHGLAGSNVAVHVHSFWQRGGDGRKGRLGFGRGEEREEGLLGGLQRLDGRLLDRWLFVASEHIVEVLQVLNNVWQSSAGFIVRMIAGCRTSLVLIVPQPPRVDARIVLGNGAMTSLWIRRVCPHQHLPIWSCPPNIHSCATCANPLELNAGALPLTRASAAVLPARSTCIRPPLLRLRTQSVHIVLLRCGPALVLVASMRRGAAVRESVLSARRASDDVISGRL